MPVYLTLGNHEGFSVKAFTTDDNDDNGDDDEDDDNDDYYDDGLGLNYKVIDMSTKIVSEINI